MTYNFIITNEGKKIVNNRVFKPVPDYNAVSQFKVGIDQTTPQITDTDLGTAVEITAGVYFKDIDSTSPEIDEVNSEVTITTFLNSAQADGNNLNAIGLFNDDATEKLFCTVTHEEESKSDTDEFSYSLIFRR